MRYLVFPNVSNAKGAVADRMLRKADENESATARVPGPLYNRVIEVTFVYKLRNHAKLGGRISLLNGRQLSMNERKFNLNLLQHLY